MASPDTRTRILDAAEHLFAERGFRGTSVRAITDLAGANLAAVGYHFGSKAELLAAVARRVIEPINAAQCAGLDRLLARTPNPPAAELVEAFAGPLFDEMPAGDEGGARTSRLIVTILTDPAEEVRSWTGPAEDTIRDRYLAAFARALPGLSPQELWFRLRGILAVVAMDRVEVYNQRTPGCVTPVASEAARRWAITFLAAAMSAPPTGSCRPGPVATATECPGPAWCGGGRGGRRASASCCYPAAADARAAERARSSSSTLTVPDGGRPVDCQARCALATSPPASSSTIFLAVVAGTAPSPPRSSRCASMRTDWARCPDLRSLYR